MSLLCGGDSDEESLPKRRKNEKTDESAFDRLLHVTFFGMDTHCAPHTVAYILQEVGEETEDEYAEKVSIELELQKYLGNELTHIFLN